MDYVEISEESIQKKTRQDKLPGSKMGELKNNFLRMLRKSPQIIKTVRDSLQQDEKFIAQFPEEVAKKLRSGEYELMKNKKTGLLNGMIRKSDGSREIVKQVNWKEIDVPDEMLENLHNLSMQATLDEISEQLTEISQNVENVLQGQHSDRVAKVKAGISLYHTAQNINDPARRDMYLANAQQNLVEGKEQLMGEIENFINLKKRDADLIDQYYWEKIRNVDKPLVDLGREIEEKKESLLESLQYIVSAYSYEFKILAFQEEYEAAEKRRAEFIDLVKNKLDFESELLTLLPYDYKHILLDTPEKILEETVLQGEKGMEIIITDEELNHE